MENILYSEDYIHFSLYIFYMIKPIVKWSYSDSFPMNITLQEVILKIKLMAIYVMYLNSKAIGVIENQHSKMKFFGVMEFFREF